MLTKQQILTALQAWINQRPGLEFGNYGTLASYRAELRSIAKDRRDALELLNAVALRDSITAEDLIAAFPRAYSGRLTLTEINGDNPKLAHAAQLDYCTGQYWPTEYRKAACAVLASALWEQRIKELKATYADGSTHYPADYMRKSFRRQFGRSIQSRWFD